MICASTPALDDPPKQADQKTQTIDTAGIQFEVLESWSTQTPTSQMRKAQIHIPAVEGDQEPAELVLFVFPGGAGSVEANIERWRNQFTDENGDHPKVETTKIKGQNVEVTRVEAAGSFKDPFAPGGPHASYRLYGAIVTTDNAGYFFKMVGPQKTMKQSAEAFNKMLTTIKTK